MRSSDWSSDVCSSDLQADSDLADTGIRTMRAGAPDVPGPAQWLADHLTKGARVNIDGQVLAVQAHRQWQTALSEKGISLVIDMDAIGDIWEGRPALPQGTVLERSEEHTSEMQSLMRLSYAVFCL